MNPLKILNNSFKIALFLLLTGSSAMSHQVPADSLITLDDAIAIALKNSLEIQIAKNDVEANTLLNNYGVAGGLPLITGTASNMEQIQNITQKLQTVPGTKRRGADGNNTKQGSQQVFFCIMEKELWLPKNVWQNCKIKAAKF